ncbi:MAG: hypothetical protein ACJ8R9_10835 [Steroidobacteraceae bacterium]
MTLTEQEWIHIEDLKELDDLVTSYDLHTERRDYLQAFFSRKLCEWFCYMPDDETFMEMVLCNIYSDEEQGVLIIREVEEGDVNQWTPDICFEEVQS